MANHLYLLQLENYQLGRFWHALRARGWQRYQPRQTIVWTPKLIALTLLAALVQGALAIAAYYGAREALEVPLARLLAAAAVYGASMWLFGVWLSVAVAVLTPLDYIVKRLVVARAKRRLAQYPSLTIIGITGSYGKTTTKEMVAAALGEQYTVVKTTGNQNTPLGLSRLITKQLTKETDILLVEMGAYGPGDIAQLCAIARPHISIVTGVNEAHLERFGSLETTLETKFEIVRHAHPDAFVVLNADDERVRSAAQKYVQPSQTVGWYGANGHVLGACRITEQTFDEKSLQQAAHVHCGAHDLGTVRTKLLGNYAWGVIAAACTVALHLQTVPERMKRGIMQLEPLEHRLQPISGASGITIIDDSYNGNPAGVRAAIAVLQRFHNRRTLYVTPGLVEMGTRSEQVHEELGRELAPAADVVIVIQTSVSNALVKGLRAGGMAEENIVVCKTAPAAHRRVQTMTNPGDVILFQNDWPDNYI